MISLIVLYSKHKEIYPACNSIHNLQCEKQVIFLMIPNGEWWHYLAEKKLSALKGVASKHKGNFCCLICLNSFRIKNKLEPHKKLYENKDFCSLINTVSVIKHHLLFMQILNV